MTPAMGRARERRTLAALWLLVFAVTSQFMVLAPVLPRIADQLGVPVARLGTLVTGYSVAVAAVALLAGPVSDRVGRRRMLLAGAAAMAVGLALHGAARGYGALLAVRVVTGAAGGVLTGATAAYVADAFPPERRGLANGWVASGMAVGQVVGIPLGTLLAAGWGFRLPFLAFGGAMALAAAMVWRWVPQPEVPRAAGPLDLRAAARDYAALLRVPAVPVAVAAFCATYLGMALYTLYLPAWLERSRGLAPGEVAALFAAGGVATALAGPPAGRLCDLWGRKRLTVAASLGLAAATLATPWAARGPWSAYAVFFLASALVAARGGPFQTLLTELVPEDRRGSLMSLSMAAGQAGWGLGAALAGSAFGRWGYASNALAAAGAALAVTLLVGRWVPETAAPGPLRPPPAPPPRPPRGAPAPPRPGSAAGAPPGPGRAP
ncbi:MAG TPA: MFS transporter [Longimicrobiaceae bacterium]|nr:MFS transporter [Longimicrobiaceae bacterium]